MDENIREIEKTLLNDKNFENVTLDISGNTASFTAYAAENCKRSSEDAVEEYTREYSNIVDMDVEVSAASTSGMGSMMTSGNTVDVTIVADELPALREGAEEIERVMSEIPGVISIDNEFNQSRVQGKLIIDEQKALAKGMTQASVAVQVSYMLNGMTACTVNYDGEEYDIKLEYPEGMYDDITALMDHPVMSATGQMISLGDIAYVEYSTTLPALSRQDGKFVTTVSATTSERDKASVTKAVFANIKNISLPEGVSRGESAMDKMTNDETSQMVTTLLTAIFLVFLVMAIQFDSPRLSLMVMLCIPFSLIGSFGLLFATVGRISIVDLMGFLVLFGIVVNNGILLVDAANELRKKGVLLGEALIQAGQTRLRPILMTTLTTVISMVPMLFSTDSGMNMMKGMAVVIVGGLVASTVLTMFMMPPFYLLIRGENINGEKKRRHRKSKEE